MNQMTFEAASDVLTFDTELPAPPEKVWQALTVPELREAWLDGPGTDPDDPTCVSVTEYEVIEADPCRLLRLAWHERGPDGAMDSVVTFALARTASGGTHLSIVHDGFAATMRPTVMAGGCRLSLGVGQGKPPPVAANDPRLLARAA